MARSQGELTVRRCRPATGSTTPLTEADNRSTEPIAVGISTSITGVGTEPSVEKAAGNIYGLFESFADNDVAGDVKIGVITGGVVRFQAGTDAGAGDLGKGIKADSTAGQVKATDAAGDFGRGCIVGYETGYIWVDLDRVPEKPGA